MHVINDFGAGGRLEERFGSVGFTLLPVAAGARVHVACLEPGGAIGRHPAVVDQCLTVLTGEATVSAGAESATLGPGQAVVWVAGEEHETASACGMTALIVEAPGLAELVCAEPTQRHTDAGAVAGPARPTESRPGRNR